MKTKIISKMLLSLGLLSVLASPVTQVRGDGRPLPTPRPQPTLLPRPTLAASSADLTSYQDESPFPLVSIYSTGDVTRGKTGSFVLAMESLMPTAAGAFVNFSVSGTAIPGVDYVALISPAQVGSSGYGVISVKTLPNPRGSFIREAYSVVITLEPGLGYVLGESRSAKMIIKP